VTFPLSSKIEVNGPERDPVYQAMVDVTDENGYSGDIRWNFEKVLLDGEGTVVARFSPQTAPDSPEIVSAIKALL
jgi:glutathione peroxidase